MPTVMLKGTEVAGEDTYADVIAAPNRPEGYSHISTVCATQDAIISLDGGVTDHILITAGQVCIVRDGVHITGAIKAKNATGGSNYASVVVHIW